MTGIYLITNKANGKKYVGQSVDVEGRWKDHIRKSRSRTNTHICNSIRRYGIENFLFEVLEECPVDKLDEREIYWISKLNTYNNGYNMTLGGGGYNQGKESYSKEYHKQYKESHKEDIRDYQKDYNKQYKEAHKKEIGEYNKQYKENHKKETEDYNKHYYQDHKEEINKKRREKYAAKKKVIINIQIEVPFGDEQV